MNTKSTLLFDCKLLTRWFPFGRIVINFTSWITTIPKSYLYKAVALWFLNQVSVFNLDYSNNNKDSFDRILFFNRENHGFKSWYCYSGLHTYWVTTIIVFFYRSLHGTDSNDSNCLIKFFWVCLQRFLVIPNDKKETFDCDNYSHSKSVNVIYIFFFCSLHAEIVGFEI